MDLWVWFVFEYLLTLMGLVLMLVIFCFTQVGCVVLSLWVFGYDVRYCFDLFTASGGLGLLLGLVVWDCVVLVWLLV